MTVRRRKDNGKWEVYIPWLTPDGVKKAPVRLTSLVQTKRGAERFEQQIRMEIANGTWGKEKKKKTIPTVKKFAEEFLNVYAVNNNKHSEVISKRGVLKNHLLPVFGSSRLDEIGAFEVEKFKSLQIENGYNKKTINNHLAVLSKMLNVAVDWNHLDFAPRIRLFRKLPDAEFDFLNHEELTRLLDASDGQYKVLFALAAKTGLRIGELRILPWNDVDLVAKRLMVRKSIVHGVIDTPKSGKGRELPLSDVAVKALKSHKNLRGDYVFCEKDGSILELNGMYRRMAFFCKKAGLRKIGYHVLRHTFASHLVMAGVPLKAVQEYLGHSDIKMTLRYAHLSPEAKRDYVNLLDKFEHEENTRPQKAESRTGGEIATTTLTACN